MSRVSRWVVFLLAGLVGMVVYGYLARPGWMGVADKTLWDWMQLLIVPLMLAGGGFLLNIRAQQYQQDRAQQAQEELEQMAAIQRAEDESLRAYLDQMNRLIIEGNLFKEPENSIVRRLAQASTIQTLLSLDTDHKRRPLALIYELDLISKDNPIISLKNTGLDAADLSEITLHDVCLREADLRLDNLSGADLKGSDLTEADLRGANLSDANLSDTVLAGANLLPYDVTAPAELSNARLLSGLTDPSDIDPSDDHLRPTNLRGADLSNADLRGAYLTGADLTNAVGLTGAELEQQAASLKGATMPNGQKYEDWLKHKGDSGEDEATPSPQ